MQSAWAVLLYIPLFAPVVWAALRFGLRIMFGIALYCTMLGCFIRVFASDDPLAFLVTAHVGSALNGVCGVIVFSLVPAFSATWFPANERTTATGTAQTLAQLGVAGAFFLSNYFVPNPTDRPSPNDQQSQRDDLQKYYVYSEFFIFIFILYLYDTG